jgi:hypothetical protein
MPQEWPPAGRDPRFGGLDATGPNQSAIDGPAALVRPFQRRPRSSAPRPADNPSPPMSPPPSRVPDAPRREHGGEPGGAGREAGLVPGGPSARGNFAAVVAYGRDLVEVDLAGTRPLANAPGAQVSACWRSSPDDPPTNAVAPLCLGAGAHGYLFVDLALALGVVTVTGDQQAREEFGAEIVNRLATAVRHGNRRLAVMVAGDPFHPDLLVVDPLRTASVRSFDPKTVPERVVVTFLVCGLDSIADAEHVVALARGPQRIVPVIVDGVVPAQWSLFVRRTP